MRGWVMAKMQVASNRPAISHISRPLPFSGPCGSLCQKGVRAVAPAFTVSVADVVPEGTVAGIEQVTLVRLLATEQDRAMVPVKFVFGASFSWVVALEPAETFTVVEAGVTVKSGAATTIMGTTTELEAVAEVAVTVTA